MLIVCSQRYVDTEKIDGSFLPDTPVMVDGIYRPHDDFIISKRPDGEILSKFSDDIWDFKPYITKASGNRRLLFHISGMDDDNPLHKSLKYEMKFLLFNCMFFTCRVTEHFISTLSLINKLEPIRRIAREILNNDFMFIRTIAEFLQDKSALKRLVGCGSGNGLKNLSALMSHLSYVGEKQIGFIPAIDSAFSLRKKDNQTPIIPPLIYLKLINKYDDFIEEFYPLRDKIKSLIKMMSNRCYASAYGTQKQLRNDYSNKLFEKNFSEAAYEHGLYDSIYIKYKVKSRSAFSCFLKRMQRVFQEIISLYTGMREQEVLRIEYDCLSRHLLSPTMVDESGNKILQNKEIIEIISTTTKYTSYKSEASWYCPELVVKVVHLSQCITDSLLTFHKGDLKQVPLFFNPSIIRFCKWDESRHCNFSSPNTSGNYTHRNVGQYFNIYSDLIISESDRLSLLASDVTRDFSEDVFQIGREWKLNMHQFRRSLAFYGSSTGFLSIPTLSTNFKHNCKKITKYYTRGFSDLNYFFGVYDELIGGYVIPKDHVIKELEVKFPISIADSLVNDIFSESKVFGKGAEYIKRVNLGFDNKSSFNIMSDCKRDTLKKVKNGEISYQKTLLGGCINPKGCECRIFGELVKCLSSECAIIKGENIDRQIEELKKFLLFYDPSSGEYQIIYSELESLEKFKKFKVGR